MGRVAFFGQLRRLLCLLLAAGALAAPGMAVWAHTVKKDPFPELHHSIDRLLEQNGLAAENVSLMLFSTRVRRFLYRMRVDQPMIAASNAKLATTYTALRVLSPNYRWKTAFYLVTEQDDLAGPARQGLLVKGGGDPTLTARAMDRIALNLKTRSLRRLKGAMYFDDSLFDQVHYPSAWGNVLGGQAWFAPVSPFIVEKNAANFFVTVGDNGNGIEVIPEVPAGFLAVASRLKSSPGRRAMVRINQEWAGKGAVFTFKGSLPAKSHTYTLSTAVTDPVAYFYHHLRASLRKLGIKGKMPMRALPAGGLPRKLLYTHRSAPLRELISDVNKESNNLAAEVVLRALALTRNTTRASGEEGLKVLEQALFEELPQFRDQVRMEDGSGLSRDTRMSASFLVHLLNRVLIHHEFRAEYLSSLSLAGWDGTLRYRTYPERLRGRIRAKSGTLSGVQNLSGYLTLDKDLVVFSFLINDSKKHFTRLQKEQDRALAGIFDALLVWENPPTETETAHRQQGKPAAKAKNPKIPKKKKKAAAKDSRRG